MYYGDIRLGDTIDIKFTTRSFTTGAPTTLSGTPVISAYVGNGTTEITAGITLTADFDSRTGLNNVRVVATGGNGFATATNVQLVITTGTVGGVSVVGEVIGSFSIECRSALMPTTATRTLDVTATGAAGIDWGNVENQSTSVNLSATTTNLVNTATTVTNQLTAAAIATGVWQDSTSGDFTVASSIGKALYINNVVPGGAGGFLISGTNTGPMSISGGVTFSNSGGSGFTCSSSGSNGSGISLSGNGSGAGLTATAGLTGSGISAVGGASGGPGINAAATTNHHGIAATGAGTGSGIAATGGSSGGASSAGIFAIGGGGNAYGIAASGIGTGHGLYAVSGTGATGDGFNATALSTNGNGIRGIGVGTGDGLHAQGGATGRGMHAVGGATSGAGFRVEGTAGNANALELDGHNTGFGFSADTLNVSGAVTFSSTWTVTGLVTFTAGLASNITGDITGNLSGSVGSVTGAVGSVTGNVGGNVVGSVASVTGNVGGNVVGTVASVVGNVGGNVTGSVGSVATGGITAASIADNAIDRATFAADTGLQTIRSNTAQAGAAGTITLDASASATDDFYSDTLIYLTGGTGVGQVRRIRDYVGSTKVATVVPNWTTNPDSTSTFAITPNTSVWDETLADHLDSGSTGAALNAAGSAGDPWATALPGAYGAGTAGFIVGTNLDATVSSRAAASTALSTAVWTNALATNLGTTNTTVAANLDATISSRMATFTLPTNFSTLLINGSGHISRVTLVDTTTTNTDMITQANVRTAVGLASANLDTQLGDLPNNAEFAAAMALLATNAQLVKVLAAVYDTATGSGGNTLTLSNGATQTINLSTGTRTLA